MIFLINAEKFYPDVQERRAKLETAISVCNEVRFGEIIEERLAMGKCANIFCQTTEVDKDIQARGRTQKMFIRSEKWTKVGNTDDMLCFCQGTEADLQGKKDECMLEYEKLKRRIAVTNEGGPFGTPMKKLVEYIKSMMDHEAMNKIDQMRIEKILKQFDHEILKVSTPEIVEKRVVDFNQEGNPSEKKANANFKVNVKNNRPKYERIEIKEEPEEDEGQIVEKQDEPKPKIQER